MEAVAMVEIESAAEGQSRSHWRRCSGRCGVFVLASDAVKVTAVEEAMAMEAATAEMVAMEGLRQRCGGSHYGSCGIWRKRQKQSYLGVSGGNGGSGVDKTFDCRRRNRSGNSRDCCRGVDQWSGSDGHGGVTEA